MLSIAENQFIATVSLTVDKSMLFKILIASVFLFNLINALAKKVSISSLCCSVLYFIGELKSSTHGPVVLFLYFFE